MKCDTSNLNLDALYALLDREYGLDITRLDFIPKGYLAYGYRATGSDGRIHFVCATGLAPAWLFPPNTNSEAVYEAVTSLSTQPGLEAIVAPYRTRAGRFTCRLGGLTIAVFPYAGAESVRDRHEAAADVAKAAQVLARLHTVPPDPTLRTLYAETFRNPFAPLILRALAEAEAAPYSGTDIQRELKALLLSTKDDSLRLLERMDRFAHELGHLKLDFVTSHGDSGLGNFLVDNAGHVHLVDWDSLGLGPPERDLSKLPGSRFDEVLSAYFDSGGARSLHPELFNFYGYWWAPEAIAYATTTILFESHIPEENADALEDLRQYLPMRWQDFEGAPNRAAVLRAHGII